MMLRKSWLLAAALSTSAITLAALFAPTDYVDFDFANLADAGKEVVFDKEGNIYVAVTGQSNGNDFDIVVVKYNPTLDQQWATPYDGPSGGDDTVSGLAIDEAGYVYVSGTSVGSTSGNDAVVLKFDPTDGDPVWPNSGGNFHNGAYRYTTSGNVADVSTDMALDANGNIYVCGKSGDATNFDAFILGLEPDGDLKSGWPQTYGGSGEQILNAVACGNGLQVAAAGAKDTASDGKDILVLSYTGGGSLSTTWTLDYDGLSDIANAVAFGTNGRVVSVSSVGTGSYSRLAAHAWQSEESDPEWSRVHSADSVGKVIGVGNGFVYAAGHRENDANGFLTVKLVESSGAYSTSWASNGSGDGVRFISAEAGLIHGIDLAGTNVYVTGEAKNANDSTPERIRYLTVRYTSSGDETWSPREFYGTSGNNDDRGFSVIGQCAGRVFVTGEHHSTNYQAGTLLYAQSTTDENPDSYTIELGYGDGDPTSHLNSSDNQYVSILQDDTQLANPLAVIRIEGNVSTSATELCFEVESKVSTSGLQQRVQLYNYDTGAYETFDTRAATTGDRTLHIQIPLDPGPYIGGSGNVKARLLFDDVGVVDLNPWTAYIDVGQWTVLN